MSYLDAPRFNFAGRFQAAPSTVNNTVQNYDTAHFDPATADMAWNKDGDHRFTLLAQPQAVKIVAATLADGTPAAATDAVLAMQLRPGGGPPAKIVDLDPQQQLVSMIFGLSLALRGASGPALLRCTMVAAPFTEIWVRGTTGGMDERAAAMYQSVLEELEWGDLAASPCLQQLRANAGDGILSIKFNLDGYSMDSESPGFTRGRIVGTIGPARRSEPRHFVVGRQLNGLVNGNPSGLFVRPRDRVNYCVGVLDATARKVRIDLGNAIPTAPSGGDAENIGTLSLVCAVPGAAALPLGAVDYRGAGWYERTAGIVELPPDRQLTDAELAAVRANPLALVRQTAPGPVTAVTEAAGGRYLRADLFVTRLNPGDKLDVEFHASRFGAPLGGARLTMAHRTLQDDPPIGEPRTALTFPATTDCDAQGRATVRLQAGDPGNRRRFIDGQVYYVDYGLDGVGTLNPSDFVSALVWDVYVPENPPTWHGSMRRIFAQYADLYPAMNARVDMRSYDAVSASRDEMLDVLRRSVFDPHYMPVTRDLSAAKLAAMIRWFSEVGADGKPLLGTPGPVPTVAARAGAARELGVDVQSGTKAAAAERIGRSRRG